MRASHVDLITMTTETLLPLRTGGIALMRLLANDNPVFGLSIYGAMFSLRIFYWEVPGWCERTSQPVANYREESVVVQC